MKKIYYLLFVILTASCTKTVEVTKVAQPITGSGSINLLSIELVNEDTISISEKYQPKIKAYYSNGLTNFLSLDSLTITSSDNTVFLSDKTYYGAKSGVARFEIKFRDTTIRDTLYISEIEEVDLTKLPFLTTPSNPSAKIIIPVVVVNYYPTLNGVDIDTKRASGYGSLLPITIQDLKNRTIDYLTLTKYGLEEGSKFRGYNNPSQTSNVSFKIVKYVNIYEIKRGLPGVQKEITDSDTSRFKQDILTPVYQPDYYDVFNKINLKSFVENEGVKEVWFSLRPISSEYPVVRDSLSNGITAANFLNLPESNMSSRLGDISNSHKMSNDLPIYNKTYVVYGYNLETSPANNIHNRGHQIEAQFSHLDSRWWGVGPSQTDGYADSTHLGWTHCPPNTTKGGDLDNKTLTLSDIEDWKPSGGTKKLINSDRWINVTLRNYPNLISTKYDYNKDPQYKWLIFWMQSMPGHNNGIAGVNDWWDIFYNWEDALRSHKKLAN